MKNLNRKCIDAEIFLLGPHLIAFSTVVYLLGTYSIFTYVTMGLVSNVLAQMLSIFTGITLFVVGVALILKVKPRKVSNIKWIPFIYVFWGLLNFITVYAMGQIIFRRPRKWSKTPRSGIIKEITISTIKRQKWKSP